MSALVYDLEIVKAVPPRASKREEGVEYCAGWDDHANMGVSVLCAFDYETNRYRVFCNDNFGDFMELGRNRRPLVGFNNLRFDNKVLAAYAPGLKVNDGECYDLLREMWAAAKLGPEFDKATHGGFSLDATCWANFGQGKSGDGGAAPAQWQRGEVGRVVDYCLHDVALTRKLYERVKAHGGLRDPRDPSRFLEMRRPT